MNINELVNIVGEIREKAKNDFVLITVGVFISNGDWDKLKELNEGLTNN